MPKEFARIISVDEEIVELENISNHKCLSCNKNTVCGFSFHKHSRKKKNIRLPKYLIDITSDNYPNYRRKAELEAGELVELHYPDKTFLKAMAMLFLIPICFMLFSMFAVFLLSKGLVPSNIWSKFDELALIVSAFAGLVISFLFIKSRANNYMEQKTFQSPNIIVYQLENG